MFEEQRSQIQIADDLKGHVRAEKLKRKPAPALHPSAFRTLTEQADLSILFIGQAHTSIYKPSRTTEQHNIHWFQRKFEKNFPPTLDS